MKKKIFFYFLPIFIGLIGLLNYIPIYFCPNFLNCFYYNYKFVIISFSFISLIILFFCIKERITILVVLGIYLLCFSFSENIRSWNNEILISYNKNKSITDFKTPILGYLLEFPDSNSKIKNCDVYFKFNKTIFFNGYEALIYKKNHQLNMNSFDGDYSLKYIYNDDWWWFKGDYD